MEILLKLMKLLRLREACNRLILRELKIKYKASFKWLISFLAIIVLAMLSSCAMLFGNTNRMVSIDSEPRGANVYINGVLYAKTPTRILLADAGYSNHHILLEKAGYESQSIEISTQFQKVGYFNFLCPIGFIADYSTDTMFQLDPKDIHQDITLVKKSVIINKNLNKFSQR